MQNINYTLNHLPICNKVLTLEYNRKHFIKSINTQLKGGTKYPLLTAALSALPGVGLFYTAAMTAIDLASRDSDVLCRTGDEIWFVEDLGKVIVSGRYVPTHVSSIFLVDPYRTKYRAKYKGWLLHERRTEVRI